jgi:hypothetical protein
MIFILSKLIQIVLNSLNDRNQENIHISPQKKILLGFIIKKYIGLKQLKLVAFNEAIVSN